MAVLIIDDDAELCELVGEYLPVSSCAFKANLSW